MLFHRFRAEFTDGIIDLIPVHVFPSESVLGFGHEQTWKIVPHLEHREMGRISFRSGEGTYIYYYGHIGYHIDPPYRGNHYAWRACRLIAPEVRLSGKSSVVITCDPDNIPSRKTCIKLGGVYEGTVHVPEEIREKYDIGPAKCRYIWIPDKQIEEIR